MREALEQPGLISLAAGFTDNPSLPVSEIRVIIKDLLKGKKGSSHLQYGTTHGDESLRKLTAQRLARMDGCPKQAKGYDPDEFLITHGSQQLLYILNEILFDPGDIVLVEDPSYFVYLGIMQSHGVHGKGIRMEPDGLDLLSLETTLETLKKSKQLMRLRALYLVSYHSNPTGTTTCTAKKEAALKILKKYEKAAGHPLYLIEDAAYRELSFSDKDTPSALSFHNAANRVIYTSTYSKPFATGIRVGYGFLPEPLFTAAARVKGNHDFGTANFLQQILSSAVENGSYEEHVQKLRKRYASKARAMTRACKKHFPEKVKWEKPEGGLYLWVNLPKKVKTGLRSKLFIEALDQKVLYVPGNLCYCDDATRRKPNHQMRLSFGSASIKDIEEGISRLGRAIKRVI
jgi:2-aminoadipate transaminase